MKVSIGQTGERLSAKFLEDKGHTIIQRNYRTAYGEIDIITCYKDIYHFHEVKTVKYGDLHPLEQITPSKIKKISRTAAIFMKENGLRDKTFTIDAIGIILTDAKGPSIVYEENITL